MGKFPDILRKAEATPFYKRKTWPTKKYCPVTTLSNLSKVFEKLIYPQINLYMSDKFSIYLTVFCKNHNTQHKGNKIGAISMDLPKAFNTVDHSLLIAKLEAYSFNSLSLEFIKNYLTNRNRHVISETVLVYGEKLDEASHKVPYLDPCFLTSS